MNLINKENCKIKLAFSSFIESNSGSFEFEGIDTNLNPEKTDLEHQIERDNVKKRSEHMAKRLLNLLEDKKSSTITIVGATHLIDIHEILKKKGKAENYRFVLLEDTNYAARLKTNLKKYHQTVQNEYKSYLDEYERNYFCSLEKKSSDYIQNCQGQPKIEILKVSSAIKAAGTLMEQIFNQKDKNAQNVSPSLTKDNFLAKTNQSSGNEDEKALQDSFQEDNEYYDHNRSNRLSIP